MKGVQCYELFGGIALKNHAFSFFNIWLDICLYRMKMSGFYYMKIVHNYRNLRQNLSNTRIYSTK